MNKQEKYFLLQCLEKLKFEWIAQEYAAFQNLGVGSPVSVLPSFFCASRGIIPISLESRLMIASLCAPLGRSLTPFELKFFMDFRKPVLSFIQDFSFEDEYVDRYVSIFKKIIADDVCLAQFIDGEGITIAQVKSDIRGIIERLENHQKVQKDKQGVAALIQRFGGWFGSHESVAKQQRDFTPACPSDGKPSLDPDSAKNSVESSSRSEANSRSIEVSTYPNKDSSQSNDANTGQPSSSIRSEDRSLLNHTDTAQLSHSRCLSGGGRQPFTSYSPSRCSGGEPGAQASYYEHSDGELISDESTSSKSTCTKKSQSSSERGIKRKTTHEVIILDEEATGFEEGAAARKKKVSLGTVKEKSFPDFSGKNAIFLKRVFIWFESDSVEKKPYGFSDLDVGCLNSRINTGVSKTFLGLLIERYKAEKSPCKAGKLFDIFNHCDLFPSAKGRKSSRELAATSLYLHKSSTNDSEIYDVFELMVAECICKDLLHEYPPIKLCVALTRDTNCKRIDLLIDQFLHCENTKDSDKYKDQLFFMLDQSKKTVSVSSTSRESRNCPIDIYREALYAEYEYLSRNCGTEKSAKIKSKAESQAVANEPVVQQMALSDEIQEKFKLLLGYSGLQDKDFVVADSRESHLSGPGTPYQKHLDHIRAIRKSFISLFNEVRSSMSASPLTSAASNRRGRDGLFDAEHAQRGSSSSSSSVPLLP